jgi:hypothetical protein
LTQPSSGLTKEQGLAHALRVTYNLPEETIRVILADPGLMRTAMDFVAASASSSLSLEQARKALNEFSKVVRAAP